jgi:hypothetical protein
VGGNGLAESKLAILARTTLNLAQAKSNCCSWQEIMIVEKIGYVDNTHEHSHSLIEEKLQFRPHYQ